MISYEGLEKALKKKRVGKTELSTELGLSTRTVAKIAKGEKLSGGLYHELQVRMTYNSNHIEGSKLSEDQTRLIFETNTLDAGDGVPVDDILETAASEGLSR